MNFYLGILKCKPKDEVSNLSGMCPVGTYLRVRVLENNKQNIEQTIC